MSVQPIPIKHLVALLGGAGAPEPTLERNHPMHALLHPLANIAFETAGLVAVWSIWRTLKEIRRG